MFRLNKVHLSRYTLTGLEFFRYVLKRIHKDRINVTAGYLTYITLLSLVPMMTVLISVLSSVSAFSDTSDMIHSFIIHNFVPAAGDVVSDALKDFIANTGKMTALGGGFLFVTSLMLISNIDKTLNYIWRVTTKRRWVFSFSMYWMVLTLGPILLGTSLAATSYIMSLSFLDNIAMTSVYHFLLKRLPFILSLLSFMGLYLLVPNKRIFVRHAFAGAFFAAILFELSKKGFALYITQFPSYQVIYGAIAAIPILFIWVYLCWLIVLLGAELTASLGEDEHWSEPSDMVNLDNQNEA